MYLNNAFLFIKKNNLLLVLFVQEPLFLRYGGLCAVEVAVFARLLRFVPAIPVEHFLFLSVQL